MLLVTHYPSPTCTVCIRENSCPFLFICLSHQGEILFTEKDLYYVKNAVNFQTPLVYIYFLHTEFTDLSSTVKLKAAFEH